MKEKSINIKATDSKNYLLIYDLWKFASKTRRVQFFFLLILILMAAVAELFSIGAIIPFIGVIADPEKIYQMEVLQPLILFFEIDNASELLLPLTVIFCFAALIAGGIRLILLWVSTRLSFAFGADISIGIYKHTLYQPYDVHSNRNSSEVISGITGKSNNVIYGIVLPFLNLISSTFLVLSIFIFLFILDPFIAFCSFFGFGIIYFLIILSSKKRLNRDSKRIADESIKVIKALQEGLGGIRDVLLDGSQSVYCETYRSSDLPLRRSQGNNLFVAQSPRFLMEAIGMLLIAIIAFISAQSAQSFSDSIPLLGGLALGAQRALPALQAAYNSWAQINGSIYSLQDAIDLLNQPISNDIISVTKKRLTFNKSMCLENISFSYPGEKEEIFKNFSLNIPKGTKVGIKGTTGSGKSTLTDILMGLLIPQSGNLVVDGNPIDVKNLRLWQNCIAHVPQSIFLADTSILGNIAFGVSEDNIDRERVYSAASKAQLSEFIEGLPDKYLSNVGERGVLLSGGQRQRIGIARAIYKNSEVVIFDEATSALDTNTENKVMESINNLRKEITVIIVAHRISTLENCDLILDLDNIGN